MRHLLILVALSLCVGCRPKAPKSTPADPVEQKRDAATTAPAPDAGTSSSADGGAASAELGPPCIDDRSCREYLRCENGHCVVPPAVDGRMVEGMPTATFMADGKVLATIHLEIADENHERTRGLMYRRRMHPSFGMLFIFDDDAERSFWMKNTLIPLDMVHIDSTGKVVGVVANAEPMTLTPRRTGVPARYVLELVAGRAAELGIEAGATMKVTGLPDAQAPTQN